ncbi:HNH endonuclease [Pseudomonas sp. gcc21]|uniref:HNH endonuclease n=1 Tax=Pseudomonas sp. gcc21 TaxID=2726989 RepID=UPI001451E775|nr:HNH endonuclease [Pseudomonas sp. gcc21]QJD59970.1 HNH endonuclease [Pseudomonas sp. gcc21]
MLAKHKALIAKELAEGTGATIAVRPANSGLRQGLAIWFDDLGQKHGPIAELKPHGLLAHSVKLSFGSFSASVISQMLEADNEEILLSRALVRSVAKAADVRFATGQSLDNWQITDSSFELVASYRPQELNLYSDEAVVLTCREVIIPLMGAMAELIGYEVIENPADSNEPEVEGGLSRAVVARRERNPRNRLLCLRVHGYACKVCGVDPRGMYGDAGGIIEVHHLEPVALLEKPRPYSPEKDLIPLCPSCHRAVHTRRPWPLSPEELSSLIGKTHA